MKLLLGFFLLTLNAIASPDPGLKPVPADRARAILTDPRLLRFTTLLKREYKVDCPLPAFDALLAREDCKITHGIEDVMTCDYSFVMSCYGYERAKDVPRFLAVDAEVGLGGDVYEMAVRVGF